MQHLLNYSFFLKESKKIKRVGPFRTLLSAKYPVRRYLSVLFILLFGGILFAQTDFDNAIIDGLHQLDSAKTMEDMQAVANKFERIAQAKPDEWLPLYYSAMVNGIQAFKIQDTEQKKALTDHALEMIDKALEINPDESEIYTLQGMIYQAVITIDPMNNGQLYSSKANGCFKTALKLNANNPRPYYLQAISLFYTPAEYGGGKKAALPLFEKAMELYKGESTEPSIYPHWGKDDCEKQLRACNTE